MRGLVDLHQHYPFTAKDIGGTAQTDFVRKALEANRKSDPELLKLQKQLVFVEMYKDVDPKLLEEMRVIYEADFRLFDYDSSPPELFEIGDLEIVHNFIDFNKQTFNVTI